MRNLSQYIEESLLDDFDLDDNTEFNEQLFTYIMDITDEDVYNNAINYIKDNSKVLSDQDREDWRKVLQYNDVCYMVMSNKVDHHKPINTIAIGMIGPNKCHILYFDDKKNCVGLLPLNTDITHFLWDSAFKDELCYVITNKKLANNFKKLKK